MTDGFKDRREKRHVSEKMQAVLLPLRQVCDEDTKECIDVALRVLSNADVEDNASTNAKIEELIDTVMVYKRGQLPDGTCPYAYFCYSNYECREDGDCTKCKEEFFANERMKLENKYLNS